MGNPPPLAQSLETSQAERRRDRIEKIKQEKRQEGNREESSLTHVENPSLTSELNRNQVAIIIPEEQDSDPYPEFPVYDSEPEISATLLACCFRILFTLNSNCSRRITITSIITGFAASTFEICRIWT